MQQMFLQKATAFLLQNTSVILSQNATVISKCDGFIRKCDGFITKCNSYYKMGCLLQNASVQGQKSCLHNKKTDIIKLTQQKLMSFALDVTGFT